MIRTWLHLKTVPASANGRFDFGNISYFCINISSFRCFHYLSNTVNYLREVSKNKQTMQQEPFWSKQYVFITNEKRSIYEIAFELSTLTIMVKHEENRNLSSNKCFQILEKHSFGVHTNDLPKICTRIEQIILYKAGLFEHRYYFSKSKDIAKTQFPCRVDAGVGKASQSQASNDFVWQPTLSHLSSRCEWLSEWPHKCNPIRFFCQVNSILN